MSEDPDRHPAVRRVAMVSLHTSPLLRPGTGDAGGLNVYVVETAAELARRGVEVDIFTRATDADQARSVELEPGLPVSVHHVPAGPLEGVPKEVLPGHVCEFADDLSRHVAGLAEGHYDVIHAHYWLSGQAGGLTSRRFDVPLVQTMHTLARVKNRALAAGDLPEPQARIDGEVELVDRADALVANTPDEARDLVELYAAAPAAVHVVPPGVDLDTFHPGDRQTARQAVGLPAEAEVLLFVGRIQPLKGPDVLVRAAGELVRRDAARRDRLVVAFLGGLSGSGLARPDGLRQVAREEGVDDLLHLGPPVSREELATWMRAADVVAVPSHHESFGLVAVEALACGTPVVVARVGGLPLAVGDVGVLVDGHDPGDWADALEQVLAAHASDGADEDWVRRAQEHAQAYSWERTVDALLDAYAAAVTARRGGHHG
ncbi:D-inositol-3-phosphate glycosyltransferase [Serinicoccus marinus]|uniref:D-inositol-3-phosphate glycosyltransferase n=1 Tax=Serinicoccus marinus TaxID=247333 RepID=UPI0031E809E9